MSNTAVSLARQNPALGEELAQFANSLTNPDNTDYTKSAGPAYVGFVENTSKKLPELLTAGCKVGNPYLSFAGKIVPLIPFEFHVVETSPQLWVRFSPDQSGKVLGVTDVDPGTWKSAYKENIEAAVLVYTPDDGLVPATVSFRSTKAGGGRVAKDGLKAAKDPSWAGKSKDHAETAKIPYPFARFFVRGEIADDTSKSSGNKLKILTGQVLTTSPAKAKALGEFFADPQKQKALASVIQRHRDRVKELSGLIGK